MPSGPIAVRVAAIGITNSTSSTSTEGLAVLLFTSSAHATKPNATTANKANLLIISIDNLSILFLIATNID
jgi:hypothetical protein